ncbi:MULTISPECIES: iron chelate uptake ABC transporter family permease subunit [Micromonospora]|uniref:Iron complex transport system permease protein n=1 Tax=Micromonospora yangpuensis TaxID=683228 RepID=A0A1C6UXA0_9ACTN|nr:iron chelate uptake ABC transporter family permease subunit [Micromonospora yangpuensis]GGM25219.1 ABC transporter permease [Micromonospora yangpuensis]SCL58429.1 iron complex transport system permease protein [Micromonospora yangpuensis]
MSYPDSRPRPPYPLVLVGAVGSLLAALGVVIGLDGVSAGAAVAAFAGLFTGEQAPHGAVAATGGGVVRVVTAAVAGAGLGLAGMCLRSLLRDALADAQVVGVSAGAAVGAVLALAMGATSAVVVSGSAFTGALVSLLVVLALAHARPATGVLLAGLGVTYAGLALVAVAHPAVAPSRSPGLVFWLWGSGAGGPWGAPVVPLSAVVLCAVVLTTQTRAMNAVASEPGSGAFRVSATRVRVLLLVAAAVLTAAAVSSVGGVGFVGLLAAHAAGWLVGADHGRTIPVALLVGAVVLVVADQVSRWVGPVADVPVGAVTALLGAPLFCAVLRRRTRGAR